MDEPFFEVRRSNPTKTHKRYVGLYSRLVRLTYDPESNVGCWGWRGLVRGRYPRFNIRTPDGKHKQIRAHRAMAVLFEIGDETECFWDLYYLYSLAGFEGDHLCEGNPLCINPDHLQLLHKEEHDKETKRRGQSVYRRFSRDPKE